MRSARLLLSCLLAICAADVLGQPPRVAIQVHADRPIGPLTPIWRFFGYDEANYTYMKDGKKLLSELAALQGPQIYIRCHHLLTSGDGAYALKWGSTSAYKEDANGNPVYDWTINDRIFDTYLEHHLNPNVEIGFMPEALSAQPQPYPRHPPVNERVAYNAGGQTYPPKDYDKWRELVYQWVKHSVEKYGAAEVASWYWEVWNEPNIGYWHAPREEYFKLYDYAVDGVRRALPNAKVGGPETAGGPGGKFLPEFLEHCARGKNYATGKTGSPLDFVAFHAKGSPKFLDGHVQMGMANQLKNIDDGFAVVASFPEFAKLPIVIGESDPEGCAACTDPQDAYRNGTVYSSYTAASFPRIYELAEKHHVNIEGALTWAFEFEDQPPFAGFRQVASDGIDLPVLNVFRMFAKMSGQRIAVEGGSGYDAEKILKQGVRAQPDVGALASLDGNRMTVFVWHYHDDDVAGEPAVVDLQLDRLPLTKGNATLAEFRVDASHGNAFEVWKRMGSPKKLDAKQRHQLEAAARMTPMGKPQRIRVSDGTARIGLELPRQGVSLFVIDLKP